MSLSSRIQLPTMYSRMRNLGHLFFSTSASGRNGLSDPRYVEHADPRLLKALQDFGIDTAYPEVTYHKNQPVVAKSTEAFKLDFYSRVEKGYEKLNEILAEGLLDSDVAEEEKEVISIKGVDNNAIDLHICRPRLKSQQEQQHSSVARTCILHIHGGGMSILSTTDPIYRATRLRLAELGFTVIGVEFRNVAGRLGPHRFPAGLNDCMSSLEYVHANKDTFNIDKIMLLGESGGANLSMATSLLARQRKVQHWIDGVYALCPYIFGSYDYKAMGSRRYPPSLRENDGLLLPRGKEMHSMAMLYLPRGTSPAKNPLAWPYHASLTDLKGLPPHVISVNELDPCRDEGLEYCAKLQEADVRARSRVVAGTCHAGELLFMKFMPDVFAATLKDVEDFANTL